MDRGREGATPNFCKPEASRAVAAVAERETRHASSSPSARGGRHSLVVHVWAMRRLVYFVAVSVDGFIASPTGAFDFFPMEGDHITAQIQELPETLPRHVRQLLGLPDEARRFGAVVMGSKTYEPALGEGIHDPYAPLETVVFSRRLPAAVEGRLRVTADDPVAVVRALKAQPGGDIWLCGGGRLAAALAPEIDELVLKVNPVLVGDGVPLVAGGFAPRRLTLRDRRAFDSGVTWLTFDVARG